MGTRTSQTCNLSAVGRAVGATSKKRPISPALSYFNFNFILAVNILHSILVSMVAVAGAGLASAASISGSSTSNVSIPDAGGYVSSTIAVTGVPAGAIVTGIDVYFKCTHPYSGDLVVDLNADSTGSSGNRNLWNREGAGADNPTRTTTGITTFNGLSVNRTWYLYAKDFASGDSGYIDEWTITIYYDAAAPPPSISSVSPASMTASSNAQTLTINGSNFVSGATLTFDPPTGANINSTAAKLTFVSSSRITYQFNNGNDVGTWTVKVNNPDGQSSGTASFLVSAVAPAPTISNVAPPSITASATALTSMTVSGANFSTSGGHLRFTDPDGLTYDSTAHPERIVSVSATQCVYQLNNGGTTGMWAVQVVNADGQSSNSASFVVQAAPSDSFYLSFPLQGYTPHTAPIVSVFDHSMGDRFSTDGQVITYKGELGDIPDLLESSTAPFSFKKPTGTPVDQQAFTVNGHYVGTLLSGPTTINYDGHPGYDYGVSIGTNVYASADGFVETANLNTSDPAGKYVRLQHPEGYQTQYLHLSEVLVSQGANVTRGQLIGKSGDTGNVTGAHLHFEVKKKVGSTWISTDPYGWEGAGADPYTQTTNVTLWQNSAPSGGDYPGAVWQPAATANYETADRTAGAVRWVIIHTTDGTTASAVQRFQNPSEGVSAHYIISRDGSVIQMVREKDIAFAAGNYTYNQKSINIEHEQYGSSNWTEAQFVASMNLVKWLSQRYNISILFPGVPNSVAPADPANGTGIIGHIQVPDPASSSIGGGQSHHTDPTNWDWGHYQALFSPVSQLPSVITGSISNVATTTASVGGSVTADGGATVTQRGVVYSSSNQTPTVSDMKLIDASAGTGSFTMQLSALSTGTTYYVRAYATNSTGTSYDTNIKNFVTICAAPTANAASNISTTGFTAKWSSVTGAVGYALDVSTTSDFSTLVSGYQNQNLGNVLSEDVTGLTAGATYYYRVRALNANSATSGNSGTISVAPLLAAPPVITTQPASQTVTVGADVTLTVSASGTGSLAYQWKKDNTPITGATAATLTLANVQRGNAGSYSVVVTDAAGSTTSSAATITVAAPPLGTAIFGSFARAVPMGTNMQLLATVNEGTPPVAYQWYFNDDPIAEATTSTLFMRDWQPADAGRYSVTITNAAGSDTSEDYEQFVQPEGGWTHLNPSPTANYLTRVAFLNGRFLIGGLRATLLTSADGLAWTTHAVPATNNLLGFTYGHGLYVAFGSLGALYTSPDLEVWTPRDSGLGQGDEFIDDIAFANDRFVGVGSRGAVTTSTDGITWTRGTIGTEDEIRNLIFAHDKFYGIAYIPAGESGTASARVYSSFDGSVWSSVPAPGPLVEIAYGAGKFVAVGDSGAIFTSSDGVSWTPAVSGSTAHLWSVSFLDGVFVATGSSGTLLTSPDGIVWTARDSDVPGGLQNAARGAGRLVAVAGATGTARGLTTSSDGLTWTQQITGPAAAEQLQAVTTDGNVIVAAGTTGTIVRSTDAKEWLAADVPTTASFNDVAYGEGTFVAVGFNSTLATSADGEAWTLQASPASSATYRGVKFGDDQFGAGVHVAVGADGVILSSPDGVTWTRRGLEFDGYGLRDVVFGGGQFVAVGYGVVLTSPDGITWTDYEVPPDPFNTVIYANGSYYATVSAASYYYVSPDGIDWTGRFSGTGGRILDFVETADGLIGVGDTGTIIGAGRPVVGKPADQTVLEGDAVTFFAPVTASPDAASYQWQKNDLDVSGATGPRLLIASATAADSGTYLLRVTNSFGSTTSAAATLNVRSNAVAPVIATQPASQSVTAGDIATFSIVATGTAPLTYQWYKGATFLVGQTSAILTLSAAQAGDAGSYTVVVSNAAGSVTSGTATLTVTPRSFAGYYRGSFGPDRGFWALQIRPDNTGVYIAFLQARRSVVVVTFTVNPDGTFTTVSSEIRPNASGIRSAMSSDADAGSGSATSGKTRLAVSEGFVFSAEITDGGLSGELAGLGESFAGSALPDTGAAETKAGFYSATALDGAFGSTYPIVAPSGEIVVVIATPSLVDGAMGAVDTHGNVKITTVNANEVDLTVDSAATLSAAVTAADATVPITFGGLAEGVASTSRLVNLSVRGVAGTGEQTLILGYVTNGAGSKKVLIRAIGPTLSNYGVSGVLTNPRLARFNASGALTDENDDWGGGDVLATTFARLGAFDLPANSPDAALLVDMPAGINTAHVRSANGDTGVALAEVYDADSGSPSVRFVNFSVRNQVGRGDDILIAGFVLNGNAPKTLLIRGIGPALTQFGLNGVLENPQIRLFRASTVITENDDWGGTAELEAAFSRTGAFVLPSASRDSALLVTLPPGIYTVHVLGVGDTTGVALVEVYELP